MSIYYANETDEYLAHYGIKGMKWGKHLKAKRQTTLNGPYVTPNEYKWRFKERIEQERKKNYRKPAKHPTSSLPPIIKRSKQEKKDFFDLVRDKDEYLRKKRNPFAPKFGTEKWEKEAKARRRKRKAAKKAKKKQAAQNFIKDFRNSNMRFISKYIDHNYGKASKKARRTRGAK